MLSRWLQASLTGTPCCRPVRPPRSSGCHGTGRRACRPWATQTPCSPYRGCNVCAAQTGSVRATPTVRLVLVGGQAGQAPVLDRVVRGEHGDLGSVRADQLAHPPLVG